MPRQVRRARILYREYPQKLWISCAAKRDCEADGIMPRASPVKAAKMARDLHGRLHRGTAPVEGMSDDDSQLYQAIAHLEHELRAALERVRHCMREREQRAMLEGEVGRAAGLAADLQLSLTRLGYGDDEEATRATARTMIHQAFDLASRYRKGLL
jgi:hypothetical protein